jgi:rare lipoprotein A
MNGKVIADRGLNEPKRLRYGKKFPKSRFVMKKIVTVLLLAVLSTSLLSSCATGSSATAKRKPTKEEWNVSTVQHGKASWYSIKTNYGTRTASGERLSNTASTAAHKTLPMGTLVRVTNVANGKSEVVRINDRGPYTKGRIIDVTVGCAERLGFYSRGVVPVKVEVLDKKS